LEGEFFTVGRNACDTVGGGRYSATENCKMCTVYPTYIQQPRRGDRPCPNFAKMFSILKTRMIVVPYAEESRMIC